MFLLIILVQEVVVWILPVSYTHLMLLASLCNNIATVTLGNHYKASAMILELIYVWVHTVGCCLLYTSMPAFRQSGSVAI